MKLYEVLTKIQTELKAPKNQFNKYGKYNYRSCEDILEAVKPLLAKYNACLTISDEIQQTNGHTERVYVKETKGIDETQTDECAERVDEIRINECAERVYVQATVVFHCGEEQLEVKAFAREAASKKGMDEAQITGAASSYARKYALAGLFLLDDNKDPDALNKHGKEPKVADNTDDNPLAVKCSVCGEILTAESYDGRDYTVPEIIAACVRRKLEPMHIACMEKIAQEGKNAE